MISKGTSFREARTVRLNRCKDVILKGIKDCSQKLSSSNNTIQENDMIAWKTERMLHVESIINNLKHRIKPKKTNSVLQRDQAIKYFFKKLTQQQTI